MGADDESMLPSLTPQNHVRPYALRQRQDKWRGSSWDEAAQPEDRPSLMEVVREFLTRKPH